ncbi:SWIM zinc finger domain-containing protein [Luteolibacter arcticus]|uniref:SWIM zinc finger domain-containing protein n=1 Tax=Luteolibacter arcticus TaxID=1581411 RepID=A0ABT3GJA5_9BACT|nr:SWIM zinc finger family protein [Luteolibacter arcticus]MCW1923607.1 SWIM zinc finger domain-containing protein [Luteolibacter arcticus]
MLTPDQITALAPDAASLKAGRGLATGRKWESAGGDDEVVWGLAMGSGKEPYQTRVSLADFATKCSCPSRKFPCKHALGLMFLATGEPSSLVQKERPPWVAEWLDSRTTRQEKAAVRAEEKATKPVDEKAAEKRRVQREGRVGDGIALLQQAILDLTREGLASGAARDAAAWENLARRMIDAQAPGLAGAARHVADTVLRDAEVDEELPLELGRLYLLLHAAGNRESLDEATRVEIDAQLGSRGDEATRLPVEDEWFVAARRVEERDRLITSASWLFGKKSRRWARVLRFAPVPQTVSEPWPVGSTVKAVLQFHPGLFPLRATPDGDGFAALEPVADTSDAELEELLDRFAAALAASPFIRAMPFLMKLRPQGRVLADEAGRALPWQAADDLALRVECIAGGRAVLMAGEWDGRHLRVSSISDGAAWIPLTPQQP